MISDGGMLNDNDFNIEDKPNKIITQYIKDNKVINQSKSILYIKQLCSEKLGASEKLEYFYRHCEYILINYPFD